MAIGVAEGAQVVTGGHAVEFLADAGGLANHVEQDFGIDPLKECARVILLVLFVGLVRRRR